MKRYFTTLISTALTVGFTLPLAAQDTPEETPVEEAVPAQTEEAGQTTSTQNVQELLEAVIDAGSGESMPAMLPSTFGEDPARTPDSFVRQGSTPARVVAPGGTNVATTSETFSLDSANATATPASKVVKDGERGIRLNFRNAPLDMVLSQLSSVAGFIIVPEVDVRGRVDVWSNQPLTKDEAVELLNKVLARQGYAVLRDGRTLTILTLAEAKKRDIPVRVSRDPETIQKDQQVVTQIIPVRFIGAVQLARDLQPLMPAQTTMAANEAGNALLITDTQANIRRLAEIIYALDTSVSSLSAVRVFPLKFADSKTVADMIKEVFGGTGTSSQGGGGGGRRGGGGGFQFGGFAAAFGGGGGADSGGSSGRPGASKVVATADERSNSLVVSAPDDLMPTIEQLITAVDFNVEDVMEIRVFTLKHADPQETATLLTSLFPDPTTQSNQRGGGGFMRGGQFGQAANATSSGDQSARMKKQSKVIAVPDNRTRSVVVTAARDTMDQIGRMVEQLDNDPARKQQVYVFEVQNTDPETVQQALQDLFSGQRTSTANRNRTTGQAGGQLNNRAQQQNQNSGNRNSGFGGGGNSGFGGGGNSGFGN